MKRFNVNGTCYPQLHYMVDTSKKIDRIAEMVERGDYFTINRARQYGKTTTLMMLEEKLKDRYIVISISFEGYGERIFRDEELFIEEFMRDISDKLAVQSADEAAVVEWNIPTLYTMKNLSRKITQLCKDIGNSIVLMIDEVDKTSNNQLFLDFLGMLRSKYLKRMREATFQSVLLAGVYDIKNIKLKLRPDEQRSYNSPWNIAASFDVDMSFSPREIATMLNEYEADHITGMNISEISNEIYRYTSGYPYLVSDICKIVDEQLDRDWTISGIRRAVNLTLGENNSLFDDMIKNIENNSSFKSFVRSILLEGQHFPFTISDPDISLGAMFGIMKRGESGEVQISNMVFETYLYNHFIMERLKQGIGTGLPERSRYIENGKLNMELVLLKFQELMKCEYRSSNGEFIEKQGRLLFLCFLKPIINGTGSYSVEGEARDGTRMDIEVFYGGEEFIIELKIWHGDKMNEKAETQLLGYLDSRNQSKGYLVSFSFNESKQYTAEWVKIDGKDIFEVVV